MVYFSNGTHGGVLDAQCGECRVPGDAPCPILHVQLIYNYDQLKTPVLREAMNLLIDTDGKCLMKPIIDDIKLGKETQTFRPPMVGDTHKDRFQKGT